MGPRVGLEAKRRAVVVLLAMIATWPLAHRALVLEVGISPWKLFGWAMYCEPRFRSRFQFLALPEDGRASTEATGATPAEPVRPRPLRFPEKTRDGRRAYGNYRRLELAFARGTSTDALARVLFDAHPSVDRLEIRVHWTRFDVSKAIPITGVDAHIHERSRFRAHAR